MKADRIRKQEEAFMKVQHASAGFERSKDNSRDHGQENGKDRQHEDGGQDRRDW